MSKASEYTRSGSDRFGTVGKANSQPEANLEEILAPYHSLSCHSGQGWVKGMTKPFPCDCSIKEAEQALTTLINKEVVAEVEKIYDEYSFGGKSELDFGKWLKNRIKELTGGGENG